ncbi:MAG: T9SS type A sorting domain-containing protein [Bacteroidota bacterium]
MRKVTRIPSRGSVFIYYLQCYLLVFFGLMCCPYLQNQLNAQIIHADGTVGDTLINTPQINCLDTSTVIYQDDGQVDGNYSDRIARNDTVLFCPSSPWDVVSLTFKIFDVAEGDTLLVFDGDTTAVRTNGLSMLKAKASGTGTSNAFGGWIESNCDPSVNPTGCLTFVFSTNGDSRKGNGWEAWVSCTSRDYQLNALQIKQYTAQCSTTEPAPVANVPIVAANIDGTCVLANRNIRVTLTNLETNTRCLQEVTTAGSTIPSSPVKLAPGAYRLIQQLVVDTVKADTTYFRVGAPNLVCNDEVTISLDALCRTAIDIDGLLEGDTCQGSGVRHRIIIKNAKGEMVRMGRQVELDTVLLGSRCGATGWTATVERTIYYANSTALCKPDSFQTSCTVAINIKDETVPIFERDTARTDTLVGCKRSLITESVLTPPIATDNCADTLTPTFTIIDTQAEYGMCEYPRVYYIKWEVSDSCGNRPNPIVDTIRMVRPTEFASPQTITEDCTKEENGLLPLVSRARVRPGLQTGKIVNGVFSASGADRLSIDTSICGYIAAIIDSSEVMGRCGGRFAFLTWAAVDLCEPDRNPIFIDSQRINFVDETAPVLDTSGLITLEQLRDSTNTRGIFTVGIRDCIFDKKEISIPAIPTATDNCAPEETITVRVKEFQRFADSTWVKVANDLADFLAQDSIYADSLIRDTFRVCYAATEICSKKESQICSHFLLKRADIFSPPVIICKDAVRVSLGNDVFNHLKVQDLVIRAEADCGAPLDTILMKRKNTTTWSTSVNVTCTDIGLPFEVEVLVRDTSGQTNTCWSAIVAEDKINPICRPLNDTVFSCHETFTGMFGPETDTNNNGQMESIEWITLNPLDQQLRELLIRYNTTFGNPQSICFDNLEDCDQLEIIQQYQLIEGTCSRQFIRRRYRASDKQGNISEWLEQNITVNYEPDWVFNFPKDIEVNCGESVPLALDLAALVETGACDIFALNVKEEQFDTPGETCKLITRTYDLINWCVYQVGEPAFQIPTNPHGISGYKVSPATSTIGRFTYTQNIKLVATQSPKIAFQPVNPCIYGVGDELPYGLEDQKLGAYPFECDTLKTFSVNASDCLGKEINKFEYDLREADILVIEKGEGSTFNYVVSPNKKYEVTFRAYDECGNLGSTSNTFYFKDCKAPTIYLVDGIRLTLDDNSEAQVWAADFDLGSWDNCSSKDKLDQRIKLGLPDLNIAEAVKTLPSALTLNCNHLGQQVVSIYIIDEAGNVSVASTSLQIQAPSDNCHDSNEGQLSLGGQITTAGGEHLNGVDIQVVSNDYSALSKSTHKGEFDFSLLPAVYTVTPKKDVNPLEGVSTYDLVLISKHILGVELLTNPYQLIAADVNKSGGISTYDLVQLRQLILNITNDFPENESWRFVNKNYQFSSSNPLTEAFSESREVRLENKRISDIDFVGIKIGDVSESIVTNAIRSVNSRSKPQKPAVAVEDRFVEAGRICKLDFQLFGMNKLEGIQFELDFPNLELTKIDEGLMKAENYNQNGKSRLVASWNGYTTGDNRLFSATFLVKKSAWLSESIKISNNQLAAEAYYENGEAFNVILHFLKEDTKQNFKLWQNTPNPFKESTKIDFQLSTIDQLVFSITDVNGKLIYQKAKLFDEGKHSIFINTLELAIPEGLYFYQLKGSNFEEYRKMIVTR